MIRLFILKLKGFSPIKVYIFKIYSSKALQWYVAWRAKLHIGKVSDEYFLEKKASKAAISREPNMKKSRKNILFDVC